MKEQLQSGETRRKIFVTLEKELKRPVATFFTSFKYPVMLENEDADILEGILQKTDLSDGLALVISSPGGDGVAAERVINICRHYSNTGEYWAIVPSKAKSAATMICFGASKLIMGGTSELGPVDPQVVMQRGDGEFAWFSAYNIVKSYDNLFKRAVSDKKGNLEPYLQQLERYDEREIEELRSALSLAEDIATRSLSTGLMQKRKLDQIKKSLEIFLTPEISKTHGRPVFAKEAISRKFEITMPDVRQTLWNLVYELYIRTNNFVSTVACKCVETKDHSFHAKPPPPKIKGKQS